MPNRLSTHEALAYLRAAQGYERHARLMARHDQRTFTVGQWREAMRLLRRHLETTRAQAKP